MCGRVFYLIVILLICDTIIESVPHRTNQETNGCVLPPHPDNGYWTLKNGTGEPGEIAPETSLIEFHCSGGYLLSKYPYVVCYKTWSEENMPTCEKMCPPWHSSSTTLVTCVNKLGLPIKCTEATDETALTYECAPYYEIPLGQRRRIFCLGGTWSHPKPECQPVCGKKNEAKPTQVGTSIHHKLEYPWVVAIYSKNEGDFNDICGGTIINKYIILTAAHCVTNEYADPFSPDVFRVAAAKLYNKYGDPRDENAQYVEVSKIIVHSQYKGKSQRFLGDIALLITKTPFKLGNLVRPACINDLTNTYLYSGLIGETAFWDITKEGLPAEELRSIEIPFQPNTTCSDALPPSSTEAYHLLDKMCASDSRNNISICKGNSGSGLFFKNVEDGRYYVNGVVSVAPFSIGSTCLTLSNTVFTKVSFYYNFLDIELSKLYKCRLPPFPKHGKWIADSDYSAIPGNIVSTNEVLTFKCDPGYKLTSSMASLDCEEATLHMPSCQPTDTSLIETTSTTFSPALGVDEFLDTLECGIKNKETLTTSSDGINYHSEYPWQVQIYKKRSFIGLGVLISRRVTITSAYMVCERDTKIPLEARLLKVGFGKYYKFYSDPRDVDAQYLEVSDVIVFDEYDGIKQGIYGDIGFLVTKNPVEFNRWIKPICIKGLDELQLQDGDVGIIYGYSNKLNKETSEINALEVTYNSRKKCINKTPHWLSYLSEDLMCGNAPNKTAYYGDGGTGWWFKNPENGRYYLHGVLGLIYIKNDILVPGENNAYVSLKFHYDYIIKVVRKFG